MLGVHAIPRRALRALRTVPHVLCVIVVWPAGFGSVEAGCSAAQAWGILGGGGCWGVPGTEGRSARLWEWIFAVGGASTRIRCGTLLVLDGWLLPHRGAEAGVMRMDVFLGSGRRGSISRGKSRPNRLTQR